MGSITAQIIVGSSHPYHGGIDPTYYVFLFENSRPLWILVPQNIFREPVRGPRKIVWIPTVENMLEDALLMIAIHVCKNKELIRLAKSFSASIKANRLELYSDLKDLHREQLYQKCREISDFPKTIVSVFKGSTIEKQLSVLKHYKMDVEVCISIYSRLYSLWARETTVNGYLPNEKEIRLKKHPYHCQSSMFGTRQV